MWSNLACSVIIIYVPCKCEVLLYEPRYVTQNLLWESLLCTINDWHVALKCSIILQQWSQPGAVLLLREGGCQRLETFLFVMIIDVCGGLLLACGTLKPCTLLNTLQCQRQPHQENYQPHLSTGLRVCKPWSTRECRQIIQTQEWMQLKDQ